MNPETRGVGGVQGPAWTRKKVKQRGPTTSARHEIYDGAVGSSSSSLSLHEPTLVQVQREAPYLTHTVRNPLGQVTLVPPDNLGRARLANSADPDIQSPPPQPKVKKTKRSKKIQAATEADPAILDAVLNAGRRPSPVNSATTATAQGSAQPVTTPSSTHNLGGTYFDANRERTNGGNTPSLSAESMHRSRSGQSNAERRIARARAAQTRADYSAASAAAAAASLASGDTAPSVPSTSADARRTFR